MSEDVKTEPDCTECRGGQAILDEAAEHGVQVNITPVPRPRHAWSDIAACPRCERAWLVQKAAP